MMQTYDVILKPCPCHGNFGKDENAPICGDWHYAGTRQEAAEAWNKRNEPQRGEAK